MMFGPAMPVLFPITLVTFMVIYILEKGMLYYGYQEPPKYDEILDKSALNVLKFAPSVMLGFAYWMFSSKQLIDNDTLIPKEHKNVPYNSGHWVIDAINPWTVFDTNSQPAIALWLAFWFSLFKAILVKVDLKSNNNLLPFSWFKSDEKEESFEIIEVIDTYWRCLDQDDRKWTIEEEKNIRENLKY